MTVTFKKLGIKSIAGDCKDSILGLSWKGGEVKELDLTEEQLEQYKAARSCFKIVPFKPEPDQKPKATRRKKKEVGDVND